EIEREPNASTSTTTGSSSDSTTTTTAPSAAGGVNSINDTTSTTSPSSTTTTTTTDTQHQPPFSDYVPGVDPAYSSSVKGARPIKPDGFTKKTIIVCSRITNKRHHVVCYYDRLDVLYGRLPTPTDSPLLSGIERTAELMEMPFGSAAEARMSALEEEERLRNSQSPDSGSVDLNNNTGAGGVKGGRGGSSGRGGKGGAGGGPPNSRLKLSAPPQHTYVYKGDESDGSKQVWRHVMMPEQKRGSSAVGVSTGTGRSEKGDQSVGGSVGVSGAASAAAKGKGKGKGKRKATPGVSSGETDKMDVDSKKSGSDGGEALRTEVPARGSAQDVGSPAKEMVVDSKSSAEIADTVGNRDSVHQGVVEADRKRKHDGSPSADETAAKVSRRSSPSVASQTEHAAGSPYGAVYSVARPPEQHYGYPIPIPGHGHDGRAYLPHHSPPQSLPPPPPNSDPRMIPMPMSIPLRATPPPAYPPAWGQERREHYQISQQPGRSGPGYYAPTGPVVGHVEMVGTPGSESMGYYRHHHHQPAAPLPPPAQHQHQPPPHQGYYSDVGYAHHHPAPPTYHHHPHHHHDPMIMTMHPPPPARYYPGEADAAARQAYPAVWDPHTSVYRPVYSVEYPPPPPPPSSSSAYGPPPHHQPQPHYPPPPLPSGPRYEDRSIPPTYIPPPVPPPHQPSSASSTPPHPSSQSQSQQQPPYSSSSSYSPPHSSIGGPPVVGVSGQQQQPQPGDIPHHHRYSPSSDPYHNNSPYNRTSQTPVASATAVGVPPQQSSPSIPPVPIPMHHGSSSSGPPVPVHTHPYHHGYQPITPLSVPVSGHHHHQHPGYPSSQSQSQSQSHYSPPVHVSPPLGRASGDTPVAGVGVEEKGGGRDCDGEGKSGSAVGGKE
ncbi:hypothetical protein HDU76_005850, partial [Blyttiomyces sp. JEL0837]